MEDVKKWRQEMSEKGMSSRLPEYCAQKNRFFNCRDQLCVNLDTGELTQNSVIMRRQSTLWRDYPPTNGKLAIL